MTIQESLKSAEDVIKPYLSSFRECYERAIKKYNRWQEAYTEPLYNRTKAINFQNIIVNEIKAAFPESEGIRVVEKYESISLVIDNRISARFKKFNSKGLPSNHKSGRNDSIVSQQLTLGFLDYPPIAWIDVGYSWNATGTEYEFLKVMCRRNDDVIWDLFFHDADTKGGAVQPDFVMPIAPDNVPGTSRVVVKTDQEEHKKVK